MLNVVLWGVLYGPDGNTQGSDTAAVDQFWSDINMLCDGSDKSRVLRTDHALAKWPKHYHHLYQWVASSEASVNLVPELHAIFP